VLGGDFQKFKARGQYGKQLSAEKKSELLARSKKIIDSDQLAELNGVIELLSAQATSSDMNRFYILIDKLDDRWVDVAIRFRLIRALIESLKAFRKITNLRLLVALRSDIVERVAQETGDITFQKEKFEDYFIKIRLNKDELKDLVNKRIEYLFKRQYTAGIISVEDVFPNRVGMDDAFDYILDRTLLRPRDVIAFINQCFEIAEGRYQVTNHMIYKAEIDYSRGRREALESEWRSAFPTLKILLNFLSSIGKEAVSFEELCAVEKIDELAFSISSVPQIDYDPIHQAAQSAFDDKEIGNFLKEAIAILYRVGVIGVKFNANERFIWSHLDMALIATTMIGSQTRVRVHPILHGSFGLRAGKGNIE